MYDGADPLSFEALRSVGVRGRKEPDISKAKTKIGSSVSIQYILPRYIAAAYSS
jgi:hypothetical protein